MWQNIFNKTNIAIAYGKTLKDLLLNLNKNLFKDILKSLHNIFLNDRKILLENLDKDIFKDLFKNLFKVLRTARE